MPARPAIAASRSSGRRCRRQRCARNVSVGSSTSAHPSGAHAHQVADLDLDHVASRCQKMVGHSIVKPRLAHRGKAWTRGRGPPAIASDQLNFSRVPDTKSTASRAATARRYATSWLGSKLLKPISTGSSGRPDYGCIPTCAPNTRPGACDSYRKWRSDSRDQTLRAGHHPDEIARDGLQDEMFLSTGATRQRRLFLRDGAAQQTVAPGRCGRPWLLPGVGVERH